MSKFCQWFRDKICKIIFETVINKSFFISSGLCKVNICVSKNKRCFTLNPVDIGRKYIVHKTLNLRPVSTGKPESYTSLRFFKDFFLIVDVDDRKVGKFLNYVAQIM